MIRVLLVIQPRLFREALGHVLAQRVELTVIGQASHADAGLAMVRSLRPDVLLIDRRLPNSDSLLSAVPAASAQTAIVELGDGAPGGAGVERDGSLDDVIASIHHAASCAPRVRSEGIDPSMGASPLTPQEERVVSLIDRGLSNKEIARELHIEVSTVKHHVHHILEKLGAKRRGQAAALLRSRHARPASSRAPSTRS